jgi:hypothetical protein
MEIYKELYENLGIDFPTDSFNTKVITNSIKENEIIKDKKRCCQDMYLTELDGYLLCVQCGIIREFYTFGISYEERVNLKTNWTLKYIPYKRINYFKSKINEIIGCETKNVPVEVIEFIKSFNFDINDINLYINIKQQLQIYYLGKYNNNIFQVIKRIGGKTIDISNMEVIKLCSMFLKFHTVFDKLIFSGDINYRNNMINYFYLIYRMLIELNIKIYYKLPLSYNNQKICKSIYEKVKKNYNKFFL